MDSNGMPSDLILRAVSKAPLAKIRQVFHSAKQFTENLQRQQGSLPLNKRMPLSDGAAFSISFKVCVFLMGTITNNVFWCYNKF